MNGKELVDLKYVMLKAPRAWRIRNMFGKGFATYHTANTGGHSVEEDALSHYHNSHYFPVHLNQTVCDRYKFAVKLGFGGSSTVWLCEDLTCVSPIAFR